MSTALDPAPVSQFLRELRESAGLTREQAAERAGVSALTWRSYEQGQRQPPHGKYLQIIAALSPQPAGDDLAGGLLAVNQWWATASRKARARVLAIVNGK